QLRLEHLPRHHHEFGIKLAVTFAPADDPGVVHDRLGTERRLPVDLETDHVAQPVGGGGRQRQAAAQPVRGRQQQPPRQLGHRRCKQPGKRVQCGNGILDGRQQRHPAQILDAVAALQSQLHLFPVDLQQQPTAVEAQHTAPPGWQPRRERSAPPVQETSRPGAQARTDVAQAAARTNPQPAHRGEAPSSQSSTVYAIPGTAPPPARTTALSSDSRPSASRARLSILYVPLRFAPTVGNAGPAGPPGGAPRCCTIAAPSRPIASSTGAEANSGCGRGNPLWTVTCGATSAYSAGVKPSTCSSSAMPSNCASFAPYGRPAEA